MTEPWTLGRNAHKHALFAEGGLEAVSMRALSTRLGISAMTPYYYFADKAELPNALWQQVLKEVVATISRALDAHAGARNRLPVLLCALRAERGSHTR
jgi:AcrR family transcriptional regulator